MLKKSLIATALAGALSLPSGAVADTLTDDLGWSADSGHESAGEVYLIPAPLAAADADRFWKVELPAPSADEIARLATENVYVATPIDDALVDPALALTAGADVYATLDDTATVESGNS